jgi:hypothetical protein
MNKTVHEGISLVIQRQDAELYNYWSYYSPVKVSFNYVHDLEVVNVFLKNQLGQLSIDQTYKVFLVHHSTLGTWLENFEKIILPIIIKYGLPLFNDLGYEPKGNK